MKNLLFPLSLLLLFSACIGDDVIFDTVPERVGITTPIDSLALDMEFQFEASYFNAVGAAVAETIVWSSSDPSIIEISESGLAKGLALGNAAITAQVSVPGKDLVEETINVVVATEVTTPIEKDRTGVAQTTSSYPLQGSFTLSKADDGTLTLSFADDYEADSGLPGLYIYLTNNPNTNIGAFEISKVSIFSGAHSYTIPEGTGLNQYSHILYFCKPFGVKVGDGVFVD